MADKDIPDYMRGFDLDNDGDLLQYLVNLKMNNLALTQK